jgi:hypothetical protein
MKRVKTVQIHFRRVAAGNGMMKRNYNYVLGSARNDRFESSNKNHQGNGYNILKKRFDMLMHFERF